MKKISTESIKNHIFSLSDEKYRKFHSSLVPGEENIVGVRVPILRQYAKELYGEWIGSSESATGSSEDAKGTVSDLLALIDDEYYEEIMLQGMIIGMQKVQPAGMQKAGSAKPAVSLEDFFSLIESFVPKITNWGICDTFCAGLKEVKKYPNETYVFLHPYLTSNEPYHMRFGLVMLLDYYIDEEHLNDIFKICEMISQGEGVREQASDYNGYYVKMAVAWLLSMCFVKFYDETLAFMKERTLDAWTYNKTIQKARESLRLTKEQKDELFQAKTLDTTQMVGYTIIGQ